MTVRSALAGSRASAAVPGDPMGPRLYTRPTAPREDVNDRPGSDMLDAWTSQSRSRGRLRWKGRSIGRQAAAEIAWRTARAEAEQPGSATGGVPDRLGRTGGRVRGRKPKTVIRTLAGRREEAGRSTARFRLLRARRPLTSGAEAAEQRPSSRWRPPRTARDGDDPGDQRSRGQGGQSRRCARLGPDLRPGARSAGSECARRFRQGARAGARIRTGCRSRTARRPA